MIRHCVFMRLQPDHDAAELAAVLAGLGALCQTLDGASNFCAGPNLDFEGKSQDYPAGFTIDFTDPAALQRYAENPEHQAFGGRLCDCCIGGGDGIVVFDLEFNA